MLIKEIVYLAFEAPWALYLLFIGLEMLVILRYRNERKK